MQKKMRLPNEARVFVHRRLGHRHYHVSFNGFDKPFLGKSIHLPASQFANLEVDSPVACYEPQTFATPAENLNLGLCHLVIKGDEAQTHDQLTVKYDASVEFRLNPSKRSLTKMLDNDVFQVFPGAFEKRVRSSISEEIGRIQSEVIHENLPSIRDGSREKLTKPANDQLGVIIEHMTVRVHHNEDPANTERSQQNDVSDASTEIRRILRLLDEQKVFLEDQDKLRVILALIDKHKLKQLTSNSNAVFFVPSDAAGLMNSAFVLPKPLSPSSQAIVNQLKKKALAGSQNQDEEADIELKARRTGKTAPKIIEHAKTRNP